MLPTLPLCHSPPLYFFLWAPFVRYHSSSNQIAVKSQWQKSWPNQYVCLIFSLFLNLMRTSYRCEVPLPLSTSVCISFEQECSSVNHYTTLQIRKQAVVQRYHSVHNVNIVNSTIGPFSFWSKILSRNIYCINFHVSLDSFSLENFLSLSLSFVSLTLLKIIGL